MSWQQIKKLREERASIHGELAAMNQKTVAEKRALTKEEDAKFNELSAKGDAIIAQIERYEAEMRMAGATGQALEDAERQKHEGNGPAGKEGRSAFENYLRGGEGALTAEQRSSTLVEGKALAREFRALTAAGVGNSGDNPVGDQVFYKTLTEKMAYFSGMRQAGATVITTGHGNPIPFGIVDGRGLEARYVTETGDREESEDFDDVFDLTNSLSAYALTTDIIPVSRVLVADMAFDVMSYIANLAGEMIGRKESRETTTGAGGGTAITGIVGSTSLSVTSAGASMVYDDLLDLQNAVDIAYTMGGRGKYQLHQNVMTSVRKMKDSTGRLIWQPGVNAAAPETINGFGVLYNNFLGTYATGGAVCGLFGDYSRYTMRDVSGAFVQRLDQDGSLVRKGMIGYIVERRVDGRLADTAAVAKLIRWDD